MTFNFQFSARSDQGRVRARNEDAYRVDAEAGLFVVADGMGGHPAGADASRMAVDRFLNHLEAAGDILTSSDAWGEHMVEAVAVAHACLLDEGDRQPERAGMGTTLTTLRINPDTGRGVLVHVGDSRAYRLREGTLMRMSHDHTWVQEKVDAGVLDTDDAHGHPLAHVLTRVLGGIPSPPVPQVQAVEARPGDLYLLCTDGLTGHLTEDDLRRLLAGAVAMDTPESLDTLAAALVQAANDLGGTDNITVVLVRVRVPEPTPPAG
jgi:protein phosphatase